MPSARWASEALLAGLLSGRDEQAGTRLQTQYVSDYLVVGAIDVEERVFSLGHVPIRIPAVSSIDGRAIHVVVLYMRSRVQE